MTDSPAQPQKIWAEHYKVPSFLVNLRGKAGLYAILNFLQDVGWMHALNMQISLPPGHGWVFTRQKLLMHEWPAWHETATIRTWLRPPVNSFWFRDYEILLGDRRIGKATASLVVMDLSTRKAVRLNLAHTKGFWNEEDSVSLDPEKIVPKGEGREIALFPVRNSDLDMNNHVNNTKYAQWILDSLPIEMLRAGVSLHGYEVNFLAEAKLGDKIAIQQFGPVSAESSLDTTFYLGVRAGDGKPIFTARLLSTGH